MKILFLGDVVGYLGRQTVSQLLPQLIKKHSPDLVIANAENAAHGKGVTESTLEELRAAGVQAFTGGNHSFAKNGSADLYRRDSFNLIRPANYPAGAPGSGEKVINIGEKKVLLVNLLGRVFMGNLVDCPFRTFDTIMARYAEETVDAVIVDFHAEATSEKNAFKHYADGRATAVIGTHTHIPTADEAVTDRGTAFITDVGGIMARDSILGSGTEEVLKNFLTQLPFRHTFPRTGTGELNAVFVAVGRNRTAKSIRRVRDFTEIT